MRQASSGRRSGAALCLATLLAAVATGGCARAPSPLSPHWQGSIGLPHRGVLTGARELPAEGPGFRVLRANAHHFGTPRFVAALERAAARVAQERPGSRLTVGDLSARTGGRIPSHASHRTGRDADLLLYMTTLEGAPVAASDFVHVGADGLAWDEARQRFLRFDVERQWLLVKALVEDPDARVQWLFASRPVAGLLLEWARARGERGETLVRAMEALVQPAPPAQLHDDHLHVRTACTPDEIAAGCEPSGPARPWLAMPAASRGDAPSTLELVQSLVTPLEPPASPLAPRPPDAQPNRHD
jgi:penicillin-insensitive murein endopeptidase